MINASREVLAGDADPLVNTVTLTCSPEDFPNMLEESASHSVDLLHPSFVVTKDCKADTEPIPQEGPAVFTIVFNNTGDADLHVVPSEGAPFDVAAGGSHSYDYPVSGPFSGQATVENTVNGTVTLHPRYELDNSYPLEASGDCRVGGRVNVLKLTQGVVDSTKSWTFNLYLGPDGYNSGALASDNTFDDADGILDFDDYNLDPELTYTLCEMGVPAGWSTFWQVDTDGNGVADTTVIPYNPNADDPTPTDVGNRCVDIGAASSPSIPIPAGGTLVFEVDNRYPGGAPRTPGYWKNWNRCTGGGQQYTAEENGGWQEGYWLLEDVLDPIIGGGIVWDDILADAFLFPIETCDDAVNILDKRSFSGKKKASDPLHNLATHLLAAQLNFGAGACTTQEVLDAALEAEELLDKYDFNGWGHDPLPKKSADAGLANELAGYLDDYNNGEFCGDSNP